MLAYRSVALLLAVSSALTVASVSGVAHAQCAASWSPGFETPTPPPSAVNKSVEFDDGSGPAIFAISASTFGRVYKFQNGVWGQVGTNLYANTSGAVGGVLHDLIVFNGELYVCGEFRRTGTTGTTNESSGSPSSNAAGIVKWSPTTGTRGSFVPVVTTSFNSAAKVAALAIQDFGSGPKLYAAGNLNLGRSLAVYNGGTSWTVFTDSFTENAATPVVRDMTAYTDALGVKKLLVCGSFGSVNGVAGTARIAAYDGTVWSSTGMPSVGSINQVKVSTGPGDNNVFVYGQIGTVATPSAWGVGRWDGTALTQMSNLSAITSQQVFLVNDGVNPGQSVYYNTGSVPGSSALARWTGTAEVPVVVGGTDIGTGVTSFDFDGAGPKPRQVFNAGRYALEGGQWVSALGNQDGKGGVPFTAMTVFDRDGVGPGRPELIGVLGSPVTTAQGNVLQRIASYNGGYVTTFGTGLADLTAGGGSVSMRSVEVFDDGSGPALHVAGSFALNGGAPVNHILKWTGAAWATLGTGVENPLEFRQFINGVYSTTQFNDGTGPAMYVGGNFTVAGGSPANYIAKWNGSTWSALGAGLPGPAVALAVHNDGSGNALYAATAVRTGSVDDGSGNPINLFNGDPSDVGVFKWDGATWTRIASQEFVVSGMASYLGQLYITGTFAVADGTTYNHIARWDGTAWLALGNGLSIASPFAGAVQGTTLRVLNNGASIDLYVGGRFTRADATDAGSIAKWNGSEFSALGTGLYGATSATPIVYAVASADDGGGTAIFATGTFTRDGTTIATNGIGRFGAPTPVIRTQPVGASVTSGATVVLSVKVDAATPATFQWQRNGVNLANDAQHAGVETDTLTINAVMATGSYRCIVTNTCGSTTSLDAVVSVPCPADFNGVGGVSIDDLFLYINAYFSGLPAADFNGVGGVTIDDLFLYINAYFVGC